MKSKSSLSFLIMLLVLLWSVSAVKAQDEKGTQVVDGVGRWLDPSSRCALGVF